MGEERYAYSSWQQNLKARGNLKELECDTMSGEGIRCWSVVRFMGLCAESSSRLAWGRKCFTGSIKELQIFQSSGRDETFLVSQELHAGI